MGKLHCGFIRQGSETTRFLAIVLAVVLALSCFCTAFAKPAPGNKAGNKIEFGLIDIKFPGIDLNFNDIVKNINLEDLFKSDAKKFGDGLVKGLLGNKTLGEIGEELGGFISNPLEGLGKLITNIGNLKNMVELLKNFGGLLGGGE